MVYVDDPADIVKQAWEANFWKPNAREAYRAFWAHHEEHRTCGWWATHPPRRCHKGRKLLEQVLNLEEIQEV